MAAAELSSLLQQQRERLIADWMDRVQAGVTAARLSQAELRDRMPAFVDEIVRDLRPEGAPAAPPTGNAEEHGAQRFRLGFDVAEVVREYGVLQECILELARGEGLAIEPRAQVQLARVMNRGIADALAQYVSQRDGELQRQASEHLGFIAHELRSPLNVGLMALRLLRDGGGAARERALGLMERSLRRATDLIESTLNHAALKLGIEPRLARVDIARMLRELEADFEGEARQRGLVVALVAPEELEVEADERLLRSALGNLLHNALKFSLAGSTVTVAAGRTDERLIVEVRDGCGGLPPGRAEELFSPLVQRGDNRSGFGLGLAIARQAAEAHNGTVKVHDLPGQGCVFSLDLPIVSAR